MQVDQTRWVISSAPRACQVAAHGTEEMIHHTVRSDTVDHLCDPAGLLGVC